MSLLERLQDDVKSALRAGEKEKVGVLRMLVAALKNAQMAQVKAAFDAAGGEAGGDAARAAAEATGQLSDAAMLDVLAKEVKRRREAAEAFRKGQREELAATEDSEAAIIEAYLPRQLSAEELRPEVAAAIAELGVSGPAEMGRVMNTLMARFKGRADGRVISQLARDILGAK